MTLFLVQTCCYLFAREHVLIYEYHVSTEEPVVVLGLVSYRNVELCVLCGIILSFRGQEVLFVCHHCGERLNIEADSCLLVPD